MSERTTTEHEGFAPDGYAASWHQGGTWDHRTPSEALEEVGRALDEEQGHDPDDGPEESLEEHIEKLRHQLALLEQVQAQITEASDPKPAGTGPEPKVEASKPDDASSPGGLSL